MASTLTIQRGVPFSATITVVDSDGNAYDLTGKTIFFTVKYQTDTAATDTDALITKDISSHTTPAAGISALDLTAVQTLIAVGTYKWDMKIYDASPLVHLQSLAGICEVVDIVTKRIV